MMDPAEQTALRLIGFITFSEAVEYTIIVPTLYGYVSRSGGGPLGYCLCFAAFSVTSTFIRPMVGYLASKQGYRSAYALILAVALLGNALYLGAGFLPPGLLAVGGIFLGRLLVGFLGGAQSLMNGYIVDVTHGRRKARTLMLCNYNLLKMFGICIGPAFNVGCSLFRLRGAGGGIVIDALNAPGVVLCGLSLALLGLSLAFMADPKRSRARRRWAERAGGAGPPPATTKATELTPLLDIEAATRPAPIATPASPARATPASSARAPAALLHSDSFDVRYAHAKLGDAAASPESALSDAGFGSDDGGDGDGDGPAVAVTARRQRVVDTVCAFAIFTLFFSVGVLEAMITPLCVHAFDWTPTQVSLCVAGVTLALLPAAAAINAAVRRGVLSDRALLALGAGVLLLSQALMCVLFRAPMRPWKMLLPLVIYEVSFPMLNAPARSIFARAPAKGSDSGVRRQGFLGFVNGIGQMLGPAWFSLSWSDVKEGGGAQGHFFVETTFGLMAVTGTLLALTCAAYGLLDNADAEPNPNPNPSPNPNPTPTHTTSAAGGGPGSPLTPANALLLTTTPVAKASGNGGGGCIAEALAGRS